MKYLLDRLQNYNEGCSITQVCLALVYIHVFVFLFDIVLENLAL